MLLRKRVWDVMRDDFLAVDGQTPFVEVVGKLRELIKAQPDNDLIVVVDENGRFSGAIGIREVMRLIEDCVLTDEAVRNAEATDWDKAFARACTLCCGTRIAGLMDKKPPRVKPGDPLLWVVNELVKGKARWAVVVEGEKPIGVVLIGDVYREISREMVAAV